MPRISQQEAIQIANDLIAANFPELANKRIEYSFVSGKAYDFYIATNYIFSTPRIIIEKEILNFSRQAFSGCLAHELAHVVLDSSRNVFQRIWYFFKARSEESYEERKADILTIERGLGEELIQFHKEHEKDYKSYNASEGLTKKEIKELLKEM